MMSDTIRMLGARYDGHPDLESFDIAYGGSCGETGGNSTPETAHALVDVFLASFRKTPLLSYQRFVLVAFPLFVAAAVLTRRHNVTRFVLLGASAVLLVWMAATFALWWWVA